MKFSEKSLVEDYIVRKLQERGWKFVPVEELKREGFEEPLLITNFIHSIQRINKELDLGDEEVSKVLNELKLIVSGPEGAKRILNFYKFGIPVKFEKERVVKYIQLFDFKNIGNNEFIVTRQVVYSGKAKIRTDIMLYTNGIPLVNIECKDPTKPGSSWFDAYKQIKDYETTVPELYKYVQIGIAAERKAKYFPIASWQDKDSVRTSEWREVHPQSPKKDAAGSNPVPPIGRGIDDQIEMLRPERILDIIKNFLFSRIEMGNATKVITRYMQYRAANKIYNRVKEFLESIESFESIESEDSMTRRPKNRGLIWHWQGSGKTLAMIFAAHKLYYDTELENPTIFFIVDRLELEDQLYTEFLSLDIIQPEIIHSVTELQEVLQYDNYRGKRGIFITLIHKFRREELTVLQKTLETVSKGNSTIMTRRNIIAFIDEGHRTQYGILAAQMKSILKEAFFFALTGTPISKSKHGRDTYLEFAYPPQELYLDRYFIVDSIRDRFTVKIVYQPRLENLHLKKDMLKVFLDVELDEIPEYARNEVEAKAKAKLNPINVFLENQTRIANIAQDIARHFKENIEGKFKAMIVAASRKACIYYKNELKKHLPEAYFDVVMTSGQGDDEIIYGYVREARKKYEWKDYKTTLKGIIDKFKHDENPKILIVTDMLLTGFDAPILQVMYLDKPLKEHRLLQAIARTNRPYKGVKEAGVIIDYVGILKEFKRALEMYSKQDKEYAINDYDSVRQDFIDLIKEIKEIFGELTLNYKRDTLLKAVEILTTYVEKEELFVEKYRTMRKVFELLGPDEIKLEYFELYKWISAIYTYYMKVVMHGTSVDAYVRKFFKKSVKYVYKTTEVEKLEKELPTIEFDDSYLQQLEEKVKSKKEKAANILFTLQRFMLVDKYKNPIYESLAERVEKMIELWRERTKDYERIYAEGVEIINEKSKLETRQKVLGLSNLEYAMLLNLEEKLGKKKNLVENIEELYNDIKKQMFPNWIKQVTVRKGIERKVRRFVRKFKSKYSLSLEDIDMLYNKLMESVKNYGT